MKRFGILLTICALLIVGTVAFAQETNSNDGIVVWTTVSNDNSNDTTINRKAEVLDENGSGQLAQVNVAMKAYIPCYLKMEFNGNTGKSVAESFGPKSEGKNTAQAINDATAYSITFDNEMGGFVDNDWKSKGAGRNIEVAPGPDVYIAACDVFRVQIYSNDNFQYDVIAAPLTQNGGTNKLNLQMGTSTKIDGTYTTVTFDTAKTVKIGEGAPCQTLQYFHKFRVPYSTTTVHGGYTGTVTFKAYTI